jgi:hypothetical protein
MLLKNIKKLSSFVQILDSVTVRTVTNPLS